MKLRVAARVSHRRVAEVPGNRQGPYYSARRPRKTPGVPPGIPPCSRSRPSAKTGRRICRWRGGPMDAAIDSRSRTDRIPQRATVPKWHYVYFLLAAFDLVTVTAGLTLNHQIMGIYRQSVEVNHVWTERVAAYSHLGQLAAEVDAPGNDVFDTREVAQESTRMDAAVRAFDLALLKQRRELERELEPQSAAPLLELLDAVAV